MTTNTCTRHKITAERTGNWNGMDWEAEYVITFTYRPGAPADFGTWPPTPAEPPEAQFIAVEPAIGVLDAGAFTDLAQADLDDWAREWLDDNFDRAMDKAQADRADQRDQELADQVEIYR